MTRHLHHSVAYLMRLYHFARERGACKWYMVSGQIAWNSCLQSVTYLLLLRFVYRISYAVCRMPYIVYCSTLYGRDHKSRVVNWIWKMESRSGNLHFVHNLFRFSDNLATLCCKLWVYQGPFSPAPSLLAYYSYIWATFVCTPNLFGCMTINFIQLPPSQPPKNHFRAHLQQ